MKKIWFQAIGVDFGSENLRVWLGDGDSILSVPSYLALDTRGHVLAIGEDARILSERNTTGIQVVRPVERGIIQDEVNAKLLLRAVIGKTRWISWIIAPSMMISVPSSATSVQRARAEALLTSLGAKEAVVIPQTLAAAIGGGIPAQDAAGSVVVQLGAGIVEAAAISLGGVIASAISEFGGKSLQDQLKRVGQEEYGVELSSETVRKLLPAIQLGIQKPASLEVIGKNIHSGAPTKVEFSAKHYEPPVIAQLEQLVLTIKKLLSKMPPAIISDVVDRGLLLSGGLAQLHGLPLLLAQRLEVPCAMMEQPDLTVIRGITTALSHLREYQEVYNS